MEVNDADTYFSDDFDDHFWSESESESEDDVFSADSTVTTDDECEFSCGFLSSEVSDGLEEESDGSEEESEHAPELMVVQAPEVLERCVRIEKIPGLSQVSTSSFRICGDNIDKTIRRRFLRSDKGNISLHYFHSYAVLNRIDFSNLSDKLPDNSSITDFTSVALSLQPTKMDDTILQRNISTLISRVLCTKMDFLKVCFEELVEWHIQHKYTPEMNQKSEVVSYPPVLSCMINYIVSICRSH